MSDKKDIKLIATDLDGTLLDHNMALSQENKTALEQAASKGVILVVATGRAYSTIPDYVKSIEGVEYAVTSNGAKTHEIKTGKCIDGQYIKESAIDAVWDVLNTKGIMLEVFVDGNPYVFNWDYVNPQIFGVDQSFIQYFMSSRKPVGDIFEFIKEHKNEIENINLVFRSPQERMEALYRLQDLEEQHQNFTLTSSFPFNLEIGGSNVDKATAIERLCSKHDIKKDNVMCLGDNSNDRTMVDFAGIGVAMENAVPDVKEVADFITKSSSESGVAFAVEKFVL